MTMYRVERDLNAEIDRIAREVQRRVDQAALDRSARKLAEFGYVKVVRCADCGHSRTERHKGDEELVCWARGTHGEVVPEDGYCHRGAR